MIYGGSIVHRVSNHVKLLGEVTSAAGRTATDGRLQNVDGVLVGYGVRFHTDNIAADVGFLKPIATKGDDGDFLRRPPVRQRVVPLAVTGYHCRHVRKAPGAARRSRRFRVAAAVRGGRVQQGRRDAGGGDGRWPGRRWSRWRGGGRGRCRRGLGRGRRGRRSVGRRRWGKRRGRDRAVRWPARVGAAARRPAPAVAGGGASGAGAGGGVGRGAAARGAAGRGGGGAAGGRGGASGVSGTGGARPTVTASPGTTLIKVNTGRPPPDVRGLGHQPLLVGEPRRRLERDRPRRGRRRRRRSDERPRL